MRQHCASPWRKAIADTAVIIPHYNDMIRLGRCLAALHAQWRPSTEVIVVDNGSDECLDHLRAAYPDLRIVTEAQKGAAYARNRGVAETTAPILCFLDCDCIPAPDWLDVAQEAATHADLVGGQVIVFDETPPPRTGAQAFEAVFAFDNRNYVMHKGFSVSANLVTWRAVFAEVGPFRHGVSEDLEWCHRATAMGKRLAYADDMVVHHPSRNDWTALERKWRRLNDETFALSPPGLRRRIIWAGRACLMPVSILIHAVRILRSPRLDHATERFGALTILIRLRLKRACWMFGQAMRDRG